MNNELFQSTKYRQILFEYYVQQDKNKRNVPFLVGLTNFQIIELELHIIGVKITRATVNNRDDHMYHFHSLKWIIKYMHEGHIKVLQVPIDSPLPHSILSYLKENK